MVIASGENNRNGYKVKLIVCGLVSVVSVSLLLLLFLKDPIVFGLRMYTRVTNGSLIHQLMYKELEGGHLSVTLFNITNADRFMAGEDQKLRVQEVGPFTYIEMRRLEDIVIDFENGTMWCSPKVRKWFARNESIGDPEELNVTMPNLPMLGLMSQVSSYNYLVRTGLNMLIHQLKSKPLVSMTVQDYLWGYEDNLLTLAHNIMPGSIKFDKIGILDRIYDSDAENRLQASIKDDDKFMIQARNGKKKLQMCPSVDPDYCELCDNFTNSYEGVGYRNGLTRDFPIRIFRNGLCKILDMEYHSKKFTSFGVEAYVYHFSDRFFSMNHSLPNDGILDMSECFHGIPLAMTKPHFLDMDPSVYELIEGIKPDEKYRGWITVEPKSGMQIETDFSVQMNLIIRDVSHSPESKPLSNMLLPICLIRIVQPPLPEESKNILNAICGVGAYIVLGFKTVLLITSILSLAYLFRYIYAERLLSVKMLKGMEKGMTFSTESGKLVAVQDPLLTSQNNNNVGTQS